MYNAESGAFTGLLTQGGVNTTFILPPYNPTAHAWWRLREASGTIYWDASPDGITWTNLGSHTYTMAITAMAINLWCGYWGTETSPPDAVVDNLNRT